MNDLIERKDVTETFAELYDIFDDYPNIAKELHKVYDKILAIPSAEKHGAWIITEQDNGHKWTHRKCSECRKGIIEPLGVSAMNYCPNCGAKMKE